MAWLFLILLLSSCGSTLYQSDRRPSQITFCPKHSVSRETLLRQAEALETRFGLSVGFSAESCQNAEIECESVPENEYAILELSLSQAQREFYKYPVEALSHAGLKNLVFVKSLTFKGSTVGGIARGDTLLINTHVNNCSLLGFQEILHHELFHIFDTQLLPNDEKNETWSKLNSATFTYFGYEQGLGFSPNLSHEREGFVSQYATTTAIEDRAETFKSLVIGIHARRVEQWSKSDSILNQKIVHLKSELERAAPSLSSAFWDKCRDSD